MRCWLLLAVFLMLFGMVAPASAAEIQSGLIAYWSLDEGSGLTAYDTAPFGVSADHGALSVAAPPAWIDGRFGKALSFADSGNYVHIPTSTDLNIGTDAVTIAGWVNLDKLPSELSGSFGSIYDSGSDPYVLYMEKGVKELRFKVTDDAGHAARPGIPEAALSIGGWHHVAAVYDGTGSVGTAKIYWDGQLKDTHTGGDGLGGTGLTGNVKTGQVADIGNNGSGTGSGDFFPGKVDDLGIWKRALTAAEIAYIAGGRALSQPAPVVHWRFEGDLTNSGTGGSQFDGTLVNGASGTNGFAAGRFGQALDLGHPSPASGSAPGNTSDGDYVSSTYTPGDTGTIALWYYTEPWYNYQTIFDNSVNADDWEFWIYGDGIARFRLQDSAYVSYDLDNVGGPNRWYHLAVGWQRQTGDPTKVDLQLFVNGVLRSSLTGGPWVDPGNFLLGGGHNGNTYGIGRWDDVRIYERLLSAEELFQMANVPEPGTWGLLAVGAAGLWLLVRRRKSS